ncbi:MAG: metallophosphoesterase, partial [bacterium]|nr:metallophosphoesterase [bacterium]
MAADGDTYIVSDLHLGSAYFRWENFVRFLDALPAGVRLVLNGDTIDEPGDPLPAAHEDVVHRLVRESRERSVIWVHGNHDESFGLADAGNIQFVRRWEVADTLLVLHGDQLDGVMPKHGLFKKIFKKFHRLRVRLGFPDMHVAHYAKRWDLLYRVLNEHVARRAIEAARRDGFRAVTCGHT